MQYKLLACDYDNTLVPFGEGRPRPGVVQAVKQMQKAGGLFVLSTGRSYPAISTPGQLGGIRFDYAITCNGACVVDAKGALVAEHPLTNEEMYALVDFCEDYNYPLQFNFRDAYYAYCEYDYLHKCYQQMNSAGLDCLDGEDQDRHLVDMPHAAFAALPPPAVEQFQQKYGYLGLHFMMVGAKNADGLCYYDIVRGGMDKGTGLADLCAQLGLTLAETVAAGDSANDCGMLAAAGLGCCMSNGTPDAKAAADRIIGDVREDGVAVLIRELWFDGPGQSLPAGSWAPPGRTSRKQGEDELRTGVRSGQPGTDPGQLAQPQKPGDGVLLWAPEQPVLADAGVPLRGAVPAPGGYPGKAAADPGPWAGAVGCAGQLHYHRRIRCFDSGSGAQ